MTAIPQLMLNLKGLLTENGIPHDKYYIRSIAHARTNKKMTFSLTKHTRRWTYFALWYFLFFFTQRITWAHLIIIFRIKSISIFGWSPQALAARYWDFKEKCPTEILRLFIYKDISALGVFILVQSFPLPLAGQAELWPKQLLHCWSWPEWRTRMRLPWSPKREPSGQ